MNAKVKLEMKADVISMLKLRKIEIEINNKEMSALDYIELLENIINKEENIEVQLKKLEVN